MLRRPLWIWVSLAVIAGASSAWATFGTNPPTGLDSQGKGFGGDLAAGQQLFADVTTRLGLFPTNDLNKAEALEFAFTISRDSKDEPENFVAELTCVVPGRLCRACTAGGCQVLAHDVCDGEGDGYVDQDALGALQSCALEALEPEIKPAFDLPASGSLRVKELIERGGFATGGESLIVYNFWELVLTSK
jgi:hypothetical protein